MLFLLLPSYSPIWPASALLGICANVGFGASVVAMNAYLPTLARASEEVVARHAELHAASEPPDAVASREGSASDPLLGSDRDSEEVSSLRTAYHTALSRATSRISSQGIALGYAAGIIMLFIALIPVNLLHGTTFSLRLAIGLSGAWWALFTMPSAVWLPSSTSSPAEYPDSEWTDSEGTQEVKTWNTKREIVKAWKRLGGILRWREIKRLRYTFQYLAAWFLLSDGPYLSSAHVSIYLLLMTSNRFHYNYINSNSLCEDVPTHARVVSHPHRDHHAHVWHSRLTDLAPDTETRRMDKSTRARHARLLG